MKPMPAIEAIDNAIEWIKQANAEEGTSNLYCTQLRGLEDLRQQLLDLAEALREALNETTGIGRDVEWSRMHNRMRAALAEYEAGKAAPAPAATGEHAPEPWRFDGRTQILAADNGDHGIIATMNRGRDFRGPECDANARRIVACVNACAGIPTAALEGATFGQDHGSVYELARDPQPKKDTP